MSHTTHMTRVNQGRNSKVHNNQYLLNEAEPSSNIFDYLPTSEINAELLVDS